MVEEHVPVCQWLVRLRVGGVFGGVGGHVGLQQHAAVLAGFQLRVPGFVDGVVQLFLRGRGVVTGLPEGLEVVGCLLSDLAEVLATSRLSVASRVSLAR